MVLTISLKLCTMLDIDKMRKVTEPDYPKKIFGSSKKYEKVVKMTVFRHFLENSTILMKLGQNVELINSEVLAKTACPKKFLFSRYSSTKFRFWPKMAKVVSKDRAISPGR